MSATTSIIRPRHGRDGREAPRRALLVALADGRVPAEYVRSVFDLRDTEVRRVLSEATHIAFGDA